MAQSLIWKREVKLMFNNKGSDVMSSCRTKGAIRQPIANFGNIHQDTEKSWRHSCNDLCKTEGINCSF